MQPGEGEFSPLLFCAVLPRNSVHAQSPFDHQSLPHLNPVLQVLGEVPPADNFELTTGIIRTQCIEPNLHLSDWGLIVLGVTQGGSLKNIHLKYAMIHPRLDQ